MYSSDNRPVLCYCRCVSVIRWLCAPWWRGVSPAGPQGTAPVGCRWPETESVSEEERRASRRSSSPAWRLNTEPVCGRDFREKHPHNASCSRLMCYHNVAVDLDVVVFGAFYFWNFFFNCVISIVTIAWCTLFLCLRLIGITFFFFLHMYNFIVLQNTVILRHCIFYMAAEKY